MESIIVGFSKPKTWKPFAWLIMVGYGIPYDHVYVKIRADKLNRDLLYQASQLTVNFMAEEIFNAANNIVQEFPVQISSENKAKLLQFAIDNSGKPYGIIEAFGLAIVRICEIFGKKIKNPFGDGGATYVCSELAGYILIEFAGAQIPENLDNITPRDVYNYLTSLNKPQMA
jgi:hypothetical protein